MGSLSGTLSFPAPGALVRTKSTLSHAKYSEEAALVRRIKQGDQLGKILSLIVRAEYN